MLRQRYVYDAEMRAYVWKYVDEGPRATGIGNTRPVVQTFVPGGLPVANVAANGGAKVKRIGGAQ